MNREQLIGAPLSGDLLELWLGCVDAWTAGLRRDAVARADELTTALAEAGQQERDEFSQWLCERLFDDGEGWWGQFGGGSSRADEGSHRPPAYLLSVNAFSSRIVVPHLGVICTRTDARSLRWLYQCQIGLRFRLQPEVRAQLDRTLHEVCGPDAAPLDALRAAAVEDEKARRWLQAVEAED